VRKWIGVTATAAALVVMGALPAGAGKDGGSAPLHVHKVVVGSAAAGTQFVVTIDCGDEIIHNDGNPVSSVQLVFDAQGNPVGTGDTVTFDDGGKCTVTETQNGGATSVVYECQGFAPAPPVPAVEGSGRFGPRPTQNGFDPCESNGPQSDPISVIIEVKDQEATVTVTNTFVTPPESPQPPPPPPEAAAVVVGAPRFTG
jgi:Domain of unknown function (DUF5979)